MAIVSGYLPVEQGVACYTALRQHAETAKAGGDSRTRDQIMADTMVQRLTGQTAYTLSLHDALPIYRKSVV